ncbi:MAG TPA: hypothetical protein P5079_01930 [Elusimicrobiota bacterium]|nr:hypothetical protein [Elusimicrobiota bacterium]
MPRLWFQVRRYVILFEGRTGSSYLTELFWSHPRIRARSEGLAAIYHDGGTAAEQLCWARAALTPPVLGRFSAVGFKTKVHEMFDPRRMAELFRAKNAHVFHMQRRNRIKLLLSEINALRLSQKTGQWNIYREEDRLPPVRVDPEEFRFLLKGREEREQKLTDYVAALGLPTLPVFYEDLVREKEKTLDRIFSFLGIEPRALRAKMIKHNSEDLREVIENFDDLRSRFVGTPYEPMFDEGAK